MNKNEPWTSDQIEAEIISTINHGNTSGWTVEMIARVIRVSWEADQVAAKLVDHIAIEKWGGIHQRT